MNRRNLFRFRRHNIINEKINEQNFESYPLTIETKNINSIIKRKKKFSNLKKICSLVQSLLYQFLH